MDRPAPTATGSADAVDIPLASMNSLQVDIHIAFVAFSAFANIALMLVCLMLAKQNSILRVNSEAYLSLVGPPVGRTMPPLVGKDTSGGVRTIRYGQDSRSKLIYSFSRECPFCQKNWVALHALQSQSTKSAIDFIYIDTVGDIFDPSFLQDSGIGSSPLFVDLSTESIPAYDARLMPQAILLNADGQVQWSHIGELRDSDMSSALSLISHP